MFLLILLRTSYAVSLLFFLIIMNGKGFLLAPIVISKIGLRLSLTHSWAHANAKHMHICTELDHARRHIRVIENLFCKLICS